MKTKHIFIGNCDIDDSMTVFVVFVGVSRYDLHLYSKLQVYAALKNGVFFRKWSKEIDDFLYNLSMQVYPSMAPSAAFAKFSIVNMRPISIGNFLQDVFPYLSTSDLPIHPRINLSQYETARKRV